MTQHQNGRQASVSEFRKFLVENAREVDKWPQWKRDTSVRGERMVITCAGKAVEGAELRSGGRNTRG